ncbi:RNA exonuclease 4 [Aristolochia californica]|uniref:RNA exonuclease 4 n=1 Tax=Aristolochia californica TaxID=171875 RepID=UPI0035D697A1
MGAEAATTDHKQSLNPNWVLLQEKLKHRPSEARTPLVKSVSDACGSMLGKRKERTESKLDSPVSTLAPLSTDCSITDEVSMDCEMVGVSMLGNKSALGRISLVNAWGNILYDEFVRPMEQVVDFRSKISGIRPYHLRKAKNFLIVQKKVAEFLKGRILVGHALQNDLKALLLSHPKEDMRDTSEYQPFLRKGGGKRALKDLAAELLGVNIQQKEHCSIEDARAAMLIYQRHKKAWEKSIKQQLRFKEKHKKRKLRKKSTDSALPSS